MEERQIKIDNVEVGKRKNNLFKTMMEWLKRVKAPKFYRYWFYQQYMFTKALGEDDPKDASMTTSALTMLFHFSLILYATTILISRDLNDIIFDNTGVIAIILYGSLFLGISYLFFSIDDKCEKILNEFANESSTQKKWRWLYVSFYLLISTLGILAILIWVIKLSQSV